MLNSGNGIYLDLTTSINAFNINKNKIYKNGGIGVVANGGSAINITGNTIEQNQLTGIYAWGTYGLNIDKNYFEANSETGINGYKADIILNGQRDYAFSKLYPNRTTSIRDNLTSSDGVPNKAFVYFVCVDKPLIEGNTRYGNEPVRLFNYYGEDSKCRVNEVVARNNSNFEPFKVDNLVALAPPVHSLTYDDVKLRGFLAQDLKRSELTEINTVGTAIQDSTMKYKNKIGFTIVGGVGFTNVYRYVINVNDIKNIKGRYITMALTYYREDNKIMPVMSVNGMQSNPYVDPTLENEFRILSMTIPVPENGVIEFDITAYSSEANSRCNFFNVCVFETGNRY